MSRFAIRSLLPWITFALTQSALQASPITYNASLDFSATMNPTGPWSYGTTGSTTSGVFNIYTNIGTYLSGNMNAWQANPGSIETDINAQPSVFKNNGPTATFASTVNLPAGQLALHPGANNEYSVVRFTAPNSGVFNYSAAFLGLDNQGRTTTDVHVLLNGVSLGSGNVNFMSSPAFSGLLLLNAGDRLDFSVGVGGNNLAFDSTGLSATITQVVPEPSSLMLFGGILIAGGMMRRQRRVSI